MFSVIVPTYNRPKTLQLLLNSLSKQTIHAALFEVLIVATNEDLSLLNKESFLRIAPNIRFIEINDVQFFGKSASLKRNKGAEQAQFSWLAFIDDDCVADPEWLSNAQKLIAEKSPCAIEGLTLIPKSDKPSFTEKGLQSLSRFGGFQTCNMFYRKDLFFEVGGFDLNLPFYLEDTDLAWSFMDKHYSILPSEKCVVTHPVPNANVYRWIENAFRSRKIPYIAKKHPLLFKKMKFKALPRSQILMALILLTFFIFWISTPSVALLLSLVSVYLLITSTYVFYLLRDCKFSFVELLKMLSFYPLITPISVFQLMRGNIEQRQFIF